MISFSVNGQALKTLLTSIVTLAPKIVCNIKSGVATLFVRDAKSTFHCTIGLTVGAQNNDAFVIAPGALMSTAIDDSTWVVSIDVEKKQMTLTGAFASTPVTYILPEPSIEPGASII
jgi:hypothetical protein